MLHSHNRPRIIPELAPHIRACTNTVLISKNSIPEELLWRVKGVAKDGVDRDSGGDGDVDSGARITSLSCGDGASEIYLAVRAARMLAPSMGTPALRHGGGVVAGN